MTSADGGPTRSGSVAVLLSFLWPGLGQAYQRRPRPAAVFAIPMLVVAAWIVYLLVTQGPEATALSLIDPAFARLVLIVGVFAGIWRVAAMAEAWWFARRARAGAGMGLATVLLAVLVVGTIGVHGWVGWLSYALYDAGTAIFVDPGGDPFASLDPGAEDPSADTATDDPSDEPSAFIETPAPDVTEAPVESPAQGERLSVLLTGVDKTPTRTHSLNDTLLVGSIDPATMTGAMASLPRDLSRIPLYFGGTYMGKINSLASYVRRHPDQFPDGPMTTLTREIGYLVGVPVPYYAAVDLNGFVKLIDLVGGVTVDNPKDINDNHYGGWTDKRPIGFHLTAGKHHLDGQAALAFARSRMGAGDSDFSRARRQQILLLALRKQMTQPDMIAKLPEIIQAAGKTIKTNFPVDKLPALLDVAGKVKSDDIERVVLGPGYSNRATDTSIYELIPDMKKFAKASIRLFGQDSRYYTPPAGASPSPSATP